MSSDFFRRTVNVGVFRQYPVVMQKREVERLAEKYGIDISGIKFKIVADSDLIGNTYTGWTDPVKLGHVQLYPDAFISEEQLIRTLLHEKAHVMWLTKYYAKHNIKYMLKSNEASTYLEKRAYRYENLWYTYLVRRA